MVQKAGFAAVFLGISRKVTMPEEASIHIAKLAKTSALKKIYKREDNWWVIYYEQRSIQSIEYNKEKHPILN